MTVCIAVQKTDTFLVSIICCIYLILPTFSLNVLEIGYRIMLYCVSSSALRKPFHHGTSLLSCIRMYKVFI